MGLPLVALSGQPAPNVLDLAGKAMQLKALQGQIGLQEGQQQIQQLTIRQQQMQMEDHEKISQALIANNGNMDGTLATLSKAGLHDPNMLIELQKQNLDRKTKLATLNEKDLANLQAHAKIVGEKSNAILALDPNDHAAAYSLVRDELVGSGQFKADELQPQFPGDTWLKLHAAMAMGVKEQVDAALKSRETAATELKAQTEANKFKAEMPGGALQDVSKAEMNDWLAKNPGKGPADYGKYKATLVPAFNFNLQGSGGPQVPLNDKQKNTAQAILEGRMSPPGSFALKQPYWQNVMGEVLRQDPEWSEQRAQLRKGYTVGKQSTEINAINTALGHVGALGDAVDALNNNNVQVLNNIANKVGVQVGQTPATTLQTIVNRVGPELVKAYSGTAGSESERQQFENDFSQKMSPAQLKANVSKTIELLRSKISSLENQWDQNKSEGMPSFQDKFIMPGAKTVLQKQAGGTSGPPREAKPGMKWQKNTRTGEYREVPDGG